MVLSFFPKSVQVTETIAYMAYGLLIVVAGCMYEWQRRKKKGEGVKTE